MTKEEATALIKATVIETLRAMGVSAPRKPRATDGLGKPRGASAQPAPPALVAWLAYHTRVTMADVLPLLGKVDAVEADVCASCGETIFRHGGHGKDRSRHVPQDEHAPSLKSLHRKGVVGSIRIGSLR